MQVTAYHPTDRDASGYPDPYYVYDIIETPAPWINCTARMASIVVISGANAPLPNPPRFTSSGGLGAATTVADSALRALKGLQGLIFI